jgi:hypothetical protein
MTFEEAVSAPAVAESLLGIEGEPVPVAMPARGSGRKDAKRRGAATNVH